MIDRLRKTKGPELTGAFLITNKETVPSDNIAAHNALALARRSMAHNTLGLAQRSKHMVQVGSSTVAHRRKRVRDSNMATLRRLLRTPRRQLPARYRVRPILRANGLPQVLRLRRKERRPQWQ
jgi:hypothetical protein